MIVIVTGGRTYAGTGLVEALDALEREEPGFYLVVGDARGADAIAREWARRRDPPNLGVFDAAWGLYSCRAGPIRNGEMVRHAALSRGRSEPIICLAAPGGRGTADCVSRCRKAGFEVREVTT